MLTKRQLIELLEQATDFADAEPVFAKSTEGYVVPLTSVQVDRASANGERLCVVVATEYFE